jgi:hypothetical protein
MAGRLYYQCAAISHFRPSLRAYASLPVWSHYSLLTLVVDQLGTSTCRTISLCDHGRARRLPLPEQGSGHQGDQRGRDTSNGLAVRAIARGADDVEGGARAFGARPSDRRRPDQVEGSGKGGGVGRAIDHAQALGKHVTLSRSRRWRSLIRGEHM